MFVQLLFKYKCSYLGSSDVSQYHVLLFQNCYFPTLLTLWCVSNIPKMFVGNKCIQNCKQSDKLYANTLHSKSSQKRCRKVIGDCIMDFIQLATFSFTHNSAQNYENMNRYRVTQISNVIVEKFTFKNFYSSSPLV